MNSCDCAGTCVGERNRRKFVLYLCLQTVEAVVLMNYVSEAISLQSSVDEWFRVNAEFLVGWVSVLFVVAITVPLLIYQAFLLSTNQTSWEHARRQSITYLRDLPTDRSPFDRGVLTNCWVFLTGGDANKWVHHEAAAR
jgi:palmitoyltransferase